MIEAVIYFVVTTISFLYIYGLLKDDIPSKKKKKVLIFLVSILSFLAIHVFLHLFGVIKG